MASSLDMVAYIPPQDHMQQKGRGHL